MKKKKILDSYNKILAIRSKQANNLDPKALFIHVQIIPGGGYAAYPANQRYPNYPVKYKLSDLEKDPLE